MEAVNKPDAAPTPPQDYGTHTAVGQLDTIAVNVPVAIDRNAEVVRAFYQLVRARTVCESLIPLIEAADGAAKPVKETDGKFVAELVDMKDEVARAFDDLILGGTDVTGETKMMLSVALPRFDLLVKTFEQDKTLNNYGMKEVRNGLNSLSVALRMLESASV